MEKDYIPDIFEEMDSEYFLLGLLSIFENQYQSKANLYFGDMTWKQFFATVCIRLLKGNPTITEISEMMKTSHQNVKQMLVKLEEKGYVSLIKDSEDRRKQRVVITEKYNKYSESRSEEADKIVSTIFENISIEDIKTTVKTIMQMERNLDKI